jgi:hypothetical protein
LWTREDFHKGDFAQSGRRFYEVMRVNHKTLTVVTGANTADLEIVTQANARNALGGPGRTGKLPYHSIKGRLTAEQARELFPDAFPPARPGPGEAAGSESDACN